MLSIAFLHSYAECRYAECLFVECRYAENRKAEYRYTECPNAECPYGECPYVECPYAECCMPHKLRQKGLGDWSLGPMLCYSFSVNYVKNRLSFEK
jgi:hypothetical protein